MSRNYPGTFFSIVTTVTVTYADADLLSCLAAAQDATLVEFAEVWCDSAKMEMAISWFLFVGTQKILSGNYDDARDHALLVRYLSLDLEQQSSRHVMLICTRLQKTCGSVSPAPAWMRSMNMNVKSITKMGISSYIRCNLPNRITERSNTMYCSRCRCVAYCSHECQKLTG